MDTARPTSIIKTMKVSMVEILNIMLYSLYDAMKEKNVRNTIKPATIK